MVDAHQKRGKTRPFGKADTEVMRDKTLPPQVKHIYAYLTTYCAAKREAWPSRSRIAEETGYDVRTVDAALRVAVEVGILDVVHEYRTVYGDRVRGTHDKPRPGEQTSNRYVLRDDTYVAGKGPGKRLPPRTSKTSGEAETTSSGEATGRPETEGGAATGRPPGGQEPPEVDNRSIPAPRGVSSINTTTPPGDDAGFAKTPKQVLGAKVTLIKPKNFGRMCREEASPALVGCFMAGVDRAGLVPVHDAQNKLGTWVNDRAHDRITHQELWRRFVALVDNAVEDRTSDWLIQREACPW